MTAIRVLDVAGSPYDMGTQHGQRVPDDVRHLARQRLLHCQDTSWSETVLTPEQIIALAEACLPAHAAYAPDLFEELTGIRDATGVSLAELLIVNGFTDLLDVINGPDAQPGRSTKQRDRFSPHPRSLSLRAREENLRSPFSLREKGSGDEGLSNNRSQLHATLGRSPATPANCTTFAAANAQTDTGQALIGQTWDMHVDALPHVVLLRGYPQDAPAFLTFTLAGCVGMIGMNEAGIAIGINDLSGAQGRVGVTWPFVVRQVLRQTTLDAALDCITRAPLAGAHNYLLMDAYGNGFNVEAMVGYCHVEPLITTLAHANRCLNTTTQAFERPLSAAGRQDSDVRYRRACAYLAEPVSVASLMALTRDRSDGIDSVCAVRPEWALQTVGAVIMRPATRDFWCVWGLPIEHDYEHIVL